MHFLVLVSSWYPPEGIVHHHRQRKEECVISRHCAQRAGADRMTTEDSCQGASVYVCVCVYIYMSHVLTDLHRRQ